MRGWGGQGEGRSPGRGGRKEAGKKEMQEEGRGKGSEGEEEKKGEDSQRREKGRREAGEMGAEGVENEQEAPDAQCQEEKGCPVQPLKPGHEGVGRGKLEVGAGQAGLTPCFNNPCPPPPAATGDPLNPPFCPLGTIASCQELCHQLPPPEEMMVSPCPGPQGQLPAQWEGPAAGLPSVLAPPS